MRKLFTLFALVALFCAGTAGAMDVWGGPPEGTWQRGEPGSTFELFDFDLPEYGPPEVFDNPFGVPTWDIFCGTFEWGEWEAPIELGPNGFVTGWHCTDPAGGAIVLHIPNQPDPNQLKAIFIQMTSTKFPSCVQVIGGGAMGPYGSGSWTTGKPHIQHDGPAPFGGLWYTYNFGRYVMPNPEYEDIIIDVPYCTVIDQVVIDTICTPDPEVTSEPSTWGEVKALFQ